MNHVVYLLADGPAYKIGWTKFLTVRVAELTREFPAAELAHTIRTDRGRKLELALHRRFAAKAIGGEWFALEPGDVALIRTLTECRWPDQLPDWLACNCRQWGITPSVPLMPSAHPLLAVRLTADEMAEFNAIRATASATIGLAVSQADLVRLGMQELKKKYPPATDSPPAPPTAPKKKGKRPATKS